MEVVQSDRNHRGAVCETVSGQLQVSDLEQYAPHFCLKGSLMTDACRHTMDCGEEEGKTPPSQAILGGGERGMMIC